MSFSNRTRHHPLRACEILVVQQNKRKTNEPPRCYLLIVFQKKSLRSIETDGKMCYSITVIHIVKPRCEF